MWVEARRRWIVFDIVFAAFFSVKGAVATALWAALPVRKAAVSTTGTGRWLRFSRKRVNARVNDSAEHCSHSYQKQRRALEKRSEGMINSNPSLLEAANRARESVLRFV